MVDSVDIVKLHNDMITILQTQYPDITNIAAYPRSRTKIATPAIFIDMIEAVETDYDPGDSRLQLNLNFEIVVIMSFMDPSVRKNVRALALSVAAFVKNQRWFLDGENGRLGPAKTHGCYQDSFATEMDQYEAWRIEFSHTAVVGVDIWDSSIPTPTDIYTVGSIDGKSLGPPTLLAHTGDPIGLADGDGNPLGDDQGNKIQGLP